MKTPFALAFLLVLAGCSDNPAALGNMGGQAVMEKAAPSAQAPGAVTGRHLALKHEIDLSVPEGALSRHFQALQQQCLKLGCEIVGVDHNISRQHTGASANLSARVPPAAFPQFFSGLQANATLRRHRSESVDKTAEVIDVDARIKNLEALRARVLALLATRTGSLKDTLDAEKQLSETQAALESIHGQRRALASLTEMVRVDINLYEETLETEGKLSAPVMSALSKTGEVLMNSVGVLITVVAALLPWALVLGLLAWPLRRVWRRRRAAKALASARAG
jgi:hypothetical protein